MNEENSNETPSDPGAPAADPSMSVPPSVDRISDLVVVALREPEQLVESLAGRASTGWRLVLLLLPAMAMVGLLIGAFAGGVQLLAVPIKVMLGTLAAMVVCLPSLFVFSNLAGIRIGVRQALGSMALAVAVLAFVLLALGPVGLVFSLSTNSAFVVGSIHVLFLSLSAWFGGRALVRLWGVDSGEKSPAGTWMFLFLIVLLQFSTTLRPLVGDYEPLVLQDKKIFLEHWFGRDEVTEVDEHSSDRNMSR